MQACESNIWFQIVLKGSVIILHCMHMYLSLYSAYLPCWASKSLNECFFHIKIYLYVPLFDCHFEIILCTYPKGVMWCPGSMYINQCGAMEHRIHYYFLFMQWSYIWQWLFFNFSGKHIYIFKSGCIQTTIFWRANYSLLISSVTIDVCKNPGLM